MQIAGSRYEENSKSEVRKLGSMSKLNTITTVHECDASEAD